MNDTQTLFDSLRQKLAAMFVATVATRILFWKLRQEGLSRFWWTEIVKELARRGEVESMRVVEVNDEP